MYARIYSNKKKRSKIKDFILNLILRDYYKRKYITHESPNDFGGGYLCIEIENDINEKIKIIISNEIIKNNCEYIYTDDVNIKKYFTNTGIKIIEPDSVR